MKLIIASKNDRMSKWLPGSPCNCGGVLAKRRVFWLLIVLLSQAAILPIPLRAEDDFQYWSAFRFELWNTEKINLSLYSEVRLQDNASDPFGYFLGPTASYRLHPNLTVGGALKHIALDNSSIDGRVELEANPHFNISKRLHFQSRNRMELFHRQGTAGFTRFRHRLRVTWRRPGSNLIGRFYFSEELFYNRQDLKVNEHRIIPFGTRLNLSRYLSVDIHYLIQYRIRSGENDINHTLGTFITLRRKS